jgi:hypothetical protein
VTNDFPRFEDLKNKNVSRILQPLIRGMRMKSPTKKPIKATKNISGWPIHIFSFIAISFS